LAGLDIDFGLADKTVAQAFMPVVINGPVLIKKQGRVNAAVVHPDRFGPGTGGIGGRHKKIAAGIHERHDQVKRAVVITQGRGINAAGSPGVVKVQLAFPGQAVSELPPMHQVPAVKNRNAGWLFRVRQYPSCRQCTRSRL